MNLNPFKKEKYSLDKFNEAKKEKESADSLVVEGQEKYQSKAGWESALEYKSKLTKDANKKVEKIFSAGKEEAIELNQKYEKLMSEFNEKAVELCMLRSQLGMDPETIKRKMLEDTEKASRNAELGLWRQKREVIRQEGGNPDR